MSAAHQKQWNNRFVQWVDDRLPVFTILQNDAAEYPTPKNLNYWWNFGSLAGIVLVIMILTGIFLAMYYTPHASMAFERTERIMRDVNYGWLIRYIHMNGATMFFITVYLHLFRGLWYGSYKQPRELLWIIGVIIILAMMATAFMGYVLPWGQMSYWGAKVITMLFSAVPLVGDSIVQWLWGGFNVANPTLNRFFSLHYLLPFVIVALVLVHIVALHTVKSNNPTGVEPQKKEDTIPFHPYYTIKDLWGLGLFLIFFAFFVFFAPNYFGEAINYKPADTMSTPAHIVPEWYFLPFYAILRAIPNKLGGVVAMFLSILILIVIPWLDRSKVRSCKYRPVWKWFVVLFVIDCFILGWVGANPAEAPYTTIGQIGTAYYFGFFIILMPLVGKLEKPKPLPESISAAVDKK